MLPQGKTDDSDQCHTLMETPLVNADLNRLNLSVTNSFYAVGFYLYMEFL